MKAPRPCSHSLHGITAIETARDCVAPELSAPDPSFRLKNGYAQDDPLGKSATQVANTTPLP